MTYRKRITEELNYAAGRLVDSVVLSHIPVHKMGVSHYRPSKIKHLRRLSKLRRTAKYGTHAPVRY